MSLAPTGPWPQILITRKDSSVLKHNTDTFMHQCPHDTLEECGSGWAERVLAVLSSHTSEAASSVGEKRPHCWSYSNASHCGLSTKSGPSGCSFQLRQRVYIYIYILYFIFIFMALLRHNWALIISGQMLRPELRSQLLFPTLSVASHCIQML